VEKTGNLGREIHNSLDEIYVAAIKITSNPHALMDRTAGEAAVTLNTFRFLGDFLDPKRGHSQTFQSAF
jgi:hypothetical protein